ncbi:hypothetical protein N9391_01115 [Gammaproteobacteria bacterium]|nr:hypothetical protein [Gammaproteobacteria bacterium]
MKFIKLHSMHCNGALWINPKQITWVNENRNGDNGVISFVGSEENYIHVTETPEEIVKLLEECE